MTHHIRIVGTTPASNSRFVADMTPVNKPIDRLIPAGQPLFHQGNQARYVFELRSGVLRQTRSLETGERQVIGFHFPGDLVGFSPDGVYRTGCTAITDARALIHRTDNLTAPGRDPGLQDHMLVAAVQAIALAQDQQVMLGRRSACAKVEAFVQYLVERSGIWCQGQLKIDIPMSRYDIADFLGLAVETVSRSLTDLRNAGVIRMDDAHRLTILRPAALANVH